MAKLCAYDFAALTEYDDQAKRHTVLAVSGDEAICAQVNDRVLPKRRALFIGDSASHHPAGGEFCAITALTPRFSTTTRLRGYKWLWFCHFCCITNRAARWSSRVEATPLRPNGNRCSRCYQPNCRLDRQRADVSGRRVTRDHRRTGPDLQPAHLPAANRRNARASRKAEPHAGADPVRHRPLQKRHPRPPRRG